MSVCVCVVSVCDVCVGVCGCVCLYVWFVCVCVCGVCVCMCVVVGVCVLRSKQEPEVGIYLCNATFCANSCRGLGSLKYSSINKFCFCSMCI